MASTELKIVLGAEVASFLSGIRSAETGLNKFLGIISGTPLHIAALGVVVKDVAKQFSEIVTSTADYGDQLYNTSQKIGISVEALSGLQYAAGLAGISNESLTVGIKKLSSAVVDSSKELKALGFTQAELSNIPTDELLLKLADKFKHMEDGAGKTALAVNLFGKSGIDLIPLLNEGAAGIKKMTDEANSFGLIIDEQAAKAADEFNDNLDRMKGLVQGITISIGNELIPKINTLVSELEKAAKSEGWKILTPQGQAGWLFQRGTEVGERLGGGWTGGTGTFGGPKTKAPAVVDEAAENEAQKQKEWIFKMRAEANEREKEYEDFMQEYRDTFEISGLKQDKEYEAFMQEYHDMIAGMKDENKGFSDGWKESLKQYIDDTSSMFNLGVDMARQTAQEMQRAFQSFFFDLFQGKITTMKELLSGLANFAAQVASNILASMATTKLLGIISSAGSSSGELTMIGDAAVNLPKAARSNEQVTVNIINSGRDEKPQISTRKQFDELVIDVIWRDYNQNGLVRRLVGA